jgi:hypothetical protein
MATIPKAGITTSSTIEAAHVTNIIDALDGTTSRQIIIPGSVDITGTTGMNGGASITGGLSIRGTLALDHSTCAVIRRLQVLDNSTSGEYGLTDYGAGTTFEIDLGQHATNDIQINIPEGVDSAWHIEYDIKFCRAAGASATLILANEGSQEIRGLNCNTNASFAITNTTGTAITSQTDLIYSHIKINNVQNIDADPFWQVRVWSNHSALLTIT